MGMTRDIPVSMASTVLKNAGGGTAGFDITIQNER